MKKRSREFNMACPKCAGLMRVRDSRPGPGNTIRRRRHCIAPACGVTVTTYEMIAELLPVSLTTLGGMLERVETSIAGAQLTLDSVKKAVAAGKVIEDLVK